MIYKKLLSGESIGMKREMIRKTKWAQWPNGLLGELNGLLGEDSLMFVKCLKSLWSEPGSLTTHLELLELLLIHFLDLHWQSK